MKKLIKFEKENCSPCIFVNNYMNDKGIEMQHVMAFDEPELSGDYNIGSVPTTLLVDTSTEVSEGVYKELDRSIGYNPTELDRLISQL